ncbi:MAG: pyridoxal kinase PdxY [Planctomycetota bacterium]|jgi:pyridoxine kinase|nr:pyridoxal kinase PdxY [Planctomycetota bacterium]
MKSVLSIQSHVVFGHAGNSAAVFPMRRLGIDVWPLNTVQFSNHTQYQEGWKGMVMSREHFLDVAAGLEGIGKLGLCDAVLSGYIGSAEQGEVLLQIAARVKRFNPQAWFFCDPVMGHPVKGCKVAPGVAEFHRDRAVLAADLMSPNVLELETLVGRELKDPAGCLEAARQLCRKGPRLVLVKHLSYAASDPNSFEMILASPEGAWHIRRPLIQFERQPVGVGDLTSGVLLASLLKGQSPCEALEFTAAAVYEVMLATREAGSYELCLVASQDAMANPRREFKAERMA